MAANDFFSRWSRRKQEAADAASPQQAPAAPADAGTLPGEAAAAGGEETLPTLADVNRLSAESDYSAFMRQGVDGATRRAAMKKLFAHPNIQAMDGLDIYIDDYTRTTPIPPAMLAALEQGKAFLARLDDESGNTQPAEAAGWRHQEDPAAQPGTAVSDAAAQAEERDALFHDGKTAGGPEGRAAGDEEEGSSTQFVTRQEGDRPARFPAPTEQRTGEMPGSGSRT